MAKKEFVIDAGKVIIHNKHCHEFIGKQGEITEVEAESYIELVKKHTQEPYRVLLNKQNSYSWTFEAQQQIRKIKGRKIFAVLGNTRFMELNYQSMYPQNSPFYRSFDVYDEALAWLDTYEFTE